MRGAIIFVCAAVTVKRGLSDVNVSSKWQTKGEGGLRLP
jgi:hypothetical protein